MSGRHRKPGRWARLWANVRTVLDPWKEVHEPVVWMDLGYIREDDDPFARVDARWPADTKRPVHVDGAVYTDAEWDDVKAFVDNLQIDWREPATMTLEAKDVALETMELVTGMFFDGAGEDPPIYAALKARTEPEWSDEPLSDDDIAALRAWQTWQAQRIAAGYHTETEPSTARKVDPGVRISNKTGKCGCSSLGPCWDHR
jgi:hypothetical protein